MCVLKQCTFFMLVNFGYFREYFYLLLPRGEDEAGEVKKVAVRVSDAHGERHCVSFYQ